MDISVYYTTFLPGSISKSDKKAVKFCNNMSNDTINLQNYEMQDYKTLYTIITPIASQHIMPHMHWHPQYEVMLIYNGAYTTHNNRTSITREGCSVFIHCPYSLHNMNSQRTPTYTRDLIYVDPHLITSFADHGIPSAAFTDASLLFAAPTKEEMEELHEITQKARKYQQDSMTGALYITILLRRILAVIQNGRGQIIRTDYSYIQDLLRLISENLSGDHTLESLAKRYDISISKLQKDFTASIGLSFHRYLTMLRQTHAKEMLLAGESIVSTSLECGYCSESHFIQSFRKYWGVTPREFTKKERK